MKKYFYLIIICFCSCNSENALDCFKAAGTIIQSEINVDPFSKILVNKKIQLFIKEGADYIDEEGNTILNKWLTDEGTAPKKYAFCADTLFTTSFLEAITGCDTMYHESTYLEIDESKAAIRFHSTAKQAAQLAILAKTKKLLLGHYSSKYRDVRVFEEEARSIFPNTFATIEGVTYEV